jgi:hypothetical protein
LSSKKLNGTDLLLENINSEDLFNKAEYQNLLTITGNNRMDLLGMSGSYSPGILSSSAK